MTRLSLEAFEAGAAAFDRSVEGDPGIDPFCSRSEWILPYHRAFLPDRELFLYRGPERAPQGAEEAAPEGSPEEAPEEKSTESGSFVALAARSHESVGLYLEALENMWCFACPLVGPGCVGLLEEAIADAARARPPERETPPLVLSGVPASREREGLLGRLVRALGSGSEPRYELRIVDETVRYVASLEGGLAGWLSRRSRKFRRGLRQAEKRAVGRLAFEPVRVESAAAVADVLPRVLAVEARSWKAAQGSGAGHGAMLAFYRDMLPRVAARGGLRLLFARYDGEDVGYLHGALSGTHFRGLQMSYEARHAHLAPGNLLQREMIALLCVEGARSYDLGTSQSYKQRWAEEGLRTLTILARPR
jgi:hypothetical protein